MSRQCTLQFKNSTGYGWSEQYHYNGANDLADATANINAMANARAGFLTSTCLLQRARLATTTPRLVQIIQLNSGAGYPGRETPPTDASEVALEAILQSATIGYNRKFIRGIPERVTGGDQYLPDMPFTDALNAWVAVLIAGDLWHIVGKPQTPTMFSASALDATLPRGYTFLAPSAGFVVGDRIRMTGATVPGYNGVKTVTQVLDATTGLYQVGGASPPVNQPASNTKVFLLGGYDLGIVTATGRRRRMGMQRPTSRGLAGSVMSIQMNI